MRKISFALAIGLCFVGAAALAQIAQPLHYLSNNTTLSTSVQGRAGEVTSIVTGNFLASSATLKLYDSATAPTCGSGTPVQTIPIATQQTISIPLPVPLKFLNGIGFCLTAGLADSDSTVVATGVVIDLGVK